MFRCFFWLRCDWMCWRYVRDVPNGAEHEYVCRKCGRTKLKTTYTGWGQG